MIIQILINFKAYTPGSSIAFVYLFSTLICNATETFEQKWKWGDSLPPSVVIVEKYKDQKPQYGTTRLPGDDVGSISEKINKDPERETRVAEKKRIIHETKK